VLGHNIGGNVSSRIRRILYYPLACAGRSQRWCATFTDAFTEYVPPHRTVRR
jgi:hypothetical protein